MRLPFLFNQHLFIAVVLIVLLSPLFLMAKDSGRCHFRVFNYPGAYDTQFAGINDQGTTVGVWSNKVTTKYGFVFAHDKFTPIRFPGSRYTYPHGINNLGDIVGEFGPAKPRSHRAGFILSGGKYKIINPPGSNGYSYAVGINDNGDILGLGDGLFVLRKGKIIHFSIPNGNAYPAGINNDEWIVGSYLDSKSEWHGFLIKNFDFDHYITIDYPGGWHTYVNAVNNQDGLIGVWSNGNGQGGTFTWKNGVFRDVPSGFFYPMGMNDFGLLSGFRSEYYLPSRGMLGTCN